MNVKEYTKKYGKEQLVCVCGHKQAVHMKLGCLVCLDCEEFATALVQPEAPPLFLGLY